MPIRILLTALFICSTSQASAQDKSEWGTSGDWLVMVDPAVGNGCLIQKDFEDGIRIRFGYHPDRKGGFFAAFNKEWRQIEVGTTGLVKFFTDEAKFAGDVEMVEEGEWRGGWAFFNNPNLTTEIAQRNAIKVVGPKGGTFSVNLSGTSRAIKMMDECQAAQPSS